MRDGAEHYFRVEVRSYAGILQVWAWLVTTVYTLLMRGTERNLSPARVCVVRLTDGVEMWHRNCYEAATVRATKERMEERIRSRSATEFIRHQRIRDPAQMAARRRLVLAGATVGAVVIAVVLGVHLFGSHGPERGSPQFQAGYQSGPTAFQQEADQNANAASGASGDTYGQSASGGSSAFDAGCLQGWDDAQGAWSG